MSSRKVLEEAFKNPFWCPTGSITNETFLHQFKIKRQNEDPTEGIRKSFKQDEVDVVSSGVNYKI